MSYKRLIEYALPIKEISSEATTEKTVRHGHISTMHIWWARRPLVACRAAVLASLLRDPVDENERNKLISFLKKFCTWDASTNPEMVDRARELVTQDCGTTPKILDCFAGGGAIPLEVLRVGGQAYALELNPVAALIELCTLVYPQRYGKPVEVRSPQSNLKGENRRFVHNRLVHDIEKWSSWVLEEAKREIGDCYPIEPDGSIPAAYLWSRTVKCPNPHCNAEVPLLRQLWLARKPNRKIALKMVIDKEKNSVDFEIAQGKEIDFDPEVGTMRYGSAECPVCRTGITRDYLKSCSRAGKMQERLTTVVLSSKDGKEYRLAQENDVQVFEKARSRLLQMPQVGEKGLTLIPDEVISRDWPRTVLPPLYGLVRWGQIYNSRQLLAITTFAEKIREVYRRMLIDTNAEYAKAITTYLALVLDRTADFSNSLCRWHPQWEFVPNLFARQAIPMAWDYAELVPFSPILSGTWKSMTRQIEKALSALEGVQTDEARVIQGTATRLPFNDSELDAVITDPPYYSAVPYADLSDFFYVWLKRSIRDLYPELFATPLTPKGPEIVEQMPHSSLKNRKDKAFFEREMTKALSEINRVLKPDGICTIAFAHKTTGAWETLITALLKSGLTVTASWPLHTEMKKRMRAQESAVLASSVWLVCRKHKPDKEVGSWKKVQEELDQRVKERLDYFLKQGIKGADALLSAIGPALEVFGRYAKVERVDGELVTVARFLDKVRETVAHHALYTVLSEQELGNVDPATAFYVVWKWTFEPGVRTSQYNASESRETDGKASNGSRSLVPFDDALKLARSVGAEIEILLKFQLLNQEKEYVRMLGPLDRKDLRTLGEISREGTPPFLIDMIHKSLILWSSQEGAKLDSYLESSGAKTNETFWKVAQALSNLLPLQSVEKQLLDGLLGRHGAGISDTGDQLQDISLDKFINEGERNDR